MLKNESLFDAEGEQLSVIEIQQVLVKNNEEIATILRDSKGQPPPPEDIGILCGIYLFSNAIASGSGGNTAPATALQQEAVPADNLPIPLLQPALGPGIQAEEDLGDQVREPFDPAPVCSQPAKVPFSRDQRVGIKDKGLSENDIKSSHAQRARQLSAATTSSRLGALRAKGSPLTGAAADTFQELFPEGAKADQDQQHQAIGELPPLPSPLNSPLHTTPTQVVTDDSPIFRDAPGTGTET